MSFEGSSLLGGATEGENTTVCVSLTLPQRLVGCAFCLAMGMILDLGAAGRVVLLIKGNPQPFVVFFTFGSLLSLGASCFLSGPTKQASQMFDEKRRVASAALLLSISLTVVVASLLRGMPGQAALLIALLLAQVLAQGLYLLSYVPFGPEMLRGACEALCAAAKRKLCGGGEASSDRHGAWGLV